MQPTQTKNSAILAFLSGGAKGASKGPSELDGIASGESTASAFAQLLEGEGALQGQKGADLLNFFKKNLNQNGSGESLESILKGLNSEQKAELFKNLSIDSEGIKSGDGSLLSPDEVLAKLDQIKNTKAGGLNNQPHLFENKLEGRALPGQKVGKSVESGKGQVQSAEDFLAQRSQLGKGRFYQANAEGSPELQKPNFGIHQYNRENNQLNSQMIKTPKFNSLESLGEVESNISSHDGASSFSADAMIVMNDAKTGEGGQGDLQGKMGDLQVIDLSQTNSTNKTELMNKISNYIQGQQMAGQENIEVLVKHDELGQFKINASKSGPGNQVDLEIQAATKQGQQFFMENEVELIKSLQKNGIKLADVKIGGGELFSMADAKSSTSDSNSGFQGRGEGQGQNQGFQGRQGSASHGHNKRQQLWQEAKEFSESLSA